MAKNCWLTKTPLQTILLLMLLVIIPFIIIMIAIYALSATAGSEISCKSFCANESHIEKSLKIPRHKYSESSEIPQTDLLENEKMNEKLPERILEEKYNNGSKKEKMYHSSVIKNYGMSEAQYTCPEDLTGDVKYPYIASILQLLYNDVTDAKDMKFICFGTIISEKWLVSSSECMGSELFTVNMLDVLYIRVGSQFWSKKGVLHEIKQVIHPSVRESQLTLSPTLIAIEVKYPFIKSPLIQPIKIPNMSMFMERAEADVFSWHADSRIVYFHRKKNEPLHTYPMEIYKENDCGLYKNRRSVFCGEELSSRDFCDYSKGGPVVKDNFLIGVHIAVNCSSDKKEHYFTDIVHYYKWLKIYTKFHHLV